MSDIEILNTRMNAFRLMDSLARECMEKYARHHNRKLGPGTDIQIGNDKRGFTAYYAGDDRFYKVITVVFQWENLPDGSLRWNSDKPIITDY